MSSRSVFHQQKNDFSKSSLFFGSPINLTRYDRQKYSIFEKLTEKQNSFFWLPQEIECSKDIKDFKSLTDHEKHIFISNLKRQILLDSVQGRAPSLALLPICSVPELENFILTWSYFETIHSRSYTHIIRNVYSNPSEVFDGILDIPEILDCAADISRHYDNLIEFNKEEKYFGSYQHKILLWKCLNAINALEGIRFYISFACSWSFAEVKKMEGNAAIIKLIARDENVHLAATQNLLKLLPKEDIDFENIKAECKPQIEMMFDSVVQQEKDWAKYLFKDGSIIGLNEQLVCEYVDWIANKRRISIGMTPILKGSVSNPLPWTQKWIAGSTVAPAPQEQPLTSYVLGGIKKDVTDNTFEGFSL